MKKILIIGGAGYIGSVLTDDLLNAGYEVCCFDNFLYHNNHCVLPYIGRKNYQFFYGDVCNLSALTSALVDVTDVVLLAGLVGDPITKKYPEIAEKINDQGIRNTIDHLKNYNIEKVVFISTCSNYGLINNDELADENFPLNPLSLYAKAKVSAENYLLNLRRIVDYTPTVLRFATAFGLSPRMRFDLTVNEFTRDLALGKELLVYDADTWRPYCHVRDFGRLIIKVLEAPLETVGFEVFNAGGDINNYTKQGIIDLILKKLPYASVRYQQHGGDPRNYRVDFRKVRDVLNFEPQYTVEDGVAELLDAMGNKIFTQVDKTPNIFGNYNIDYNLK